jgi:sugar phosphate isomerase/epimerase
MTRPDLLATCWTTAGDAVPLPGRDDSPIALPVRIESAARFGFTGFGVVHNDLRTYLRDSDLTTLRSVLRDNGIQHVELEFLTHWWEVGTPARAESDLLLDLLLRASEVLQPHHVKVGPDITGGAYDLAQWAEQWHRISKAFANAGTVIALEFMPFSNISTLERAVELVETAGHPAGGLMIDMWHIMRGGAHQLAQVGNVPLQLITGVELDDGDAEQVGDGYSDTVLRRRLPGQGVWPVHELIRILRDKGWTGPWGVEILSETYRVRPLDEALPEVVSATLEQFALAEREVRR